MICKTQWLGVGWNPVLHQKPLHCEGGIHCCIRCGPDEERILDIVPREDGARNSG